ncbi:hypothetical protein [Aeromicrobium sp. PE09-221]|uniref:hypothetical protein n=1 Tax=Aeromicrobium sp. PE09-221 TaxID=1898043 RepID=UPI00111C9FA2|nr:hypothetical protein [Aeromicrobium sp. PE09-221]
MSRDMMSSLASSFDSLPFVLQILVVAVIGVVPFLESYVGAFVGTLVGLPAPVALVAAVLGNVLAVLIAVAFGSRIAQRRERQRQQPRTPRQEKVMARVDRWGVPIASLLAPMVLAISLTAFIMTTVGLARRQVVVWQIAAVVLWGGIFTAFGLGLLSVAG